MLSDWGSASSGQEVRYVIAAQNTRATGDMQDLRITAKMPDNLGGVTTTDQFTTTVYFGTSQTSRETLIDDVLSGNDPKLTPSRNVAPTTTRMSSREVSLQFDTLKPGEYIFVAIETRVKEGVAVGTRIVNQAQLTFTGIKVPAYSNIATVLVVGTAPTQVAVVQATATVTPTLAATSTATPSATTTASATTNAASPSPTAAPAPPTIPPAGATAAPRAPLPETSTGVPILGFMLLGMTMMLRTVRVHRAQSRL
jgi:hypothetical protein